MGKHIRSLAKFGRHLQMPFLLRNRDNTALEAANARIAELEDHAVLATLAKNNDQLRARIASLERRCTTSEAAHSDTIDDLNRLRAVTATANARIAELEELRVTETRKWAAAEARAERAERAEARVVDLEEIVKGVHFLRKQAEAERNAMRDGNRPLPYDRDHLGRLVREVWVRWAYTQPNPKPSRLVNYNELTEPDKEADRQIGECIARWTLIGDAARAAPDGRNLAVLYCMERAEEDVKLLREALEGMIAVAEGRFDGNPHADIDALAKARAALNRSPAGREG